jgi:hypothetical protein
MGKHVAPMGQKRNARSVLVGKPERKIPLRILGIEERILLK